MVKVSFHTIRNGSRRNEFIVLTGSICLNTDLSDLSIVGTCDLCVYCYGFAIKDD